MGDKTKSRPAAPVTTELDEFIRDRMHQAKLPGLAAALVKDGHLLWAKGFGWADVEGQRPVTTDTVFKVASISKTVTAATILKACEDGLLDLDGPVNEHLPFAVTHPRDAKKPITLRMLLSHTSGLRDNPDILETLYTVGEVRHNLRQFLNDYLKSGGCYYDAQANFTEESPGTAFEFCSVGLSLAGYVLECVAGQPFDAYTERSVFELLGMDGAAWWPARIEKAPLAYPYRHVRFMDAFEHYGHYAFPHYPGSGLHCSVAQLWRLFGVFSGERLHGVPQLLSDDTARLMRTEHYPDAGPGIGLGCYYEERDGLKLLGHAGADHGVAARMFWNEAQHAGVITLGNGEPTTKARWTLMAIENRLFDAAQALDEAAFRSAEPEPNYEDRVVPFPKRHAS